MSVISPQAMLLWATLSSTLLLFLVQHLYRYDRFQCLKWRSSSDGGFKRFMTYSYIISVPLLTTYMMKYQAGYIALPNPASTPAHPLPRIIIPAPTETWPEAHQKIIFPLYVLFAVAWSLEIVSHLEELCFWLFMIRESGGEGEGGVRPWFKSFEYKLWCVGSTAAVLLPLVTIETRDQLEQVEAWTFFTGSVGSLAITLWFIQVWKFPSFLKKIQDENADPEVIVRLVAFQDLNRLRIFFRMMFVIPLLILACDGIRADGPHVIAKTPGAVDILAMVGGIGCIVSSVITLLASDLCFHLPDLTWFVAMTSDTTFDMPLPHDDERGGSSSPITHTLRSCFCVLNPRFRCPLLRPRLRCPSWSAPRTSPRPSYYYTPCFSNFAPFNIPPRATQIFFPRSIAREAGYATRARTHTSQMQSKSGQAPATKSQPTFQQRSIIRHEQQAAREREEMRSPGSSNFPYSPGFPRSPAIVSQNQVHSLTDTASVTRPLPAHRRTISSSLGAGSPTTPVGSDPLNAASAQPRRPFGANTPDGATVQVTIQTTVRGDSSYFGRPSGGTVVLGDEELPAYIGEGLSDMKRRSDEDEEERLPPHPNQRYHTGSDVFAASGPSVIRMGSVNGSRVPLTRGTSSRGRARGLHPLLINYTSPIDLHVSDDAQIGRAF
ncbi:hypothetical protein RhiJN_12454 [Ceratobasidium sp. AG-Ba]|nr:hypothetical protein RhiJN_12454 [Ceratobasidium sp. AG-Ba]